MNSKNKKLVVFLRHNNDIDQIVPVMYKWLCTRETPIDVYITGYKHQVYDWRLLFLSKNFQNIRVRHITDLNRCFDYMKLFFKTYNKYQTLTENMVESNSFLSANITLRFRKVARQIFNDIDDCVIIFDWIQNNFVKQVLEVGNEKGFKGISLPHGDAPYINMLFREQDININTYEKNKAFDIFDYVVVPNKWCEMRFKRHLRPGAVKVLGSARYCKDWVDVLGVQSTPYNVKDTEDKIKIAMFLRNTSYTINWDEVQWAIKLIMQFQEVHLAIKPHTRINYEDSFKHILFDKHKDLKKETRLSFIPIGVNSTSIIKWADVILDLGTTALWEAIRVKKPLLCLDYLHSNVSTIGHYIKECKISSKDELFIRLKTGIKLGFENFYDETEWNDFMENIIDYPNGNVLERYCDFIASCFK